MGTARIHICSVCTYLPHNTYTLLPFLTLISAAEGIFDSRIFDWVKLEMASNNHVLKMTRTPHKTSYSYLFFRGFIKEMPIQLIFMYQKVRAPACSWWRLYTFLTAWSLYRPLFPTACLGPPPPPIADAQSDGQRWHALSRPAFSWQVGVSDYGRCITCQQYGNIIS